MAKFCVISFTLFSLFIYGTAKSQDCKNLIKNEVDEFTGQIKKTTKTRVFKQGYQEVFLIAEKINDDFQLTVNYSNSSMRGVDAAIFEAFEDDKIFFLLQDSTVLSLNLLAEAVSSRVETADVGTRILLGRYAGLAKSNKIIFEPEYNIDISAITQLKEKKILKIRIEARGTRGVSGRKLDNIELVIRDQDATTFMKDIDCLLNK